MRGIKSKTRTRILSLAIFSFLLIGVLSTSIVASSTYQHTLTKGTDEFVVGFYDSIEWKASVSSNLTPSNWFEGEANITNAKSKATLKIWTLSTWGTYDVFTSIFMLAHLNETAINANYTNSYSLWYGQRSVWNYTSNDYEEDPSHIDDEIIILQNPLDYKAMLDDYNNLAGSLNGTPSITADEFLWQLALNGLAIAEPQADYLKSIVSELGCENASVIGSTLIFERYGLTNYTVEISYGDKGMMSSFTVKDLSDTVIYQITSSNSEWLFYLILIIVSVSSVALVVYVVFRNRMRKR